MDRLYGLISHWANLNPLKTVHIMRTLLDMLGNESLTGRHDPLQGRSFYISLSACWTKPVTWMLRLHVRIDSWHTCIDQRFRKRSEPSFWLPLESILSPNRFIPVRCVDADNDVSAFWNVHFVDHLSIHTPHRIEQRED